MLATCAGGEPQSDRKPEDMNTVQIILRSLKDPIGLARNILPGTTANRTPLDEKVIKSKEKIINKSWKGIRIYNQE